MSSILSTVSGISFVLACVFLLISVLFFIRFDIPGIIGDLTGRTAKKTIANMRKSNEENAKKAFSANRINANPNKYINPIKNLEKIDNKTDNLNSDSDQSGTVMLKENAADSQSTVLLNDENATDILIENTYDLNKSAAKKIKPVDSGNVKLTMIEEIILIHTDETI
jgi:hypothetical protein